MYLSAETNSLYGVKALVGWRRVSMGVLCGVTSLLRANLGEERCVPNARLAMWRWRPFNFGDGDDPFDSLS